jgi:hypothetical protein
MPSDIVERKCYHRAYRRAYRRASTANSRAGEICLTASGAAARVKPSALAVL